ncbi:hypothetical protein [Nocardioides cavernaquae]|uniref:Transaldolase n=1 Tax=Nocardioides cavernaquae TaxID=2321396 RepID=A0A3A5H9R8_9ACTN|nr:hypothetical protein [Nocardioides cavernaquae]RJS46125.1 hypothetical protein D4739_07785 [Nocardioides cavernaquae]
MSTLVPEVLAGLLDDAAIFPPGNASLPEAVISHAAHLRNAYAAALGPLVVRVADLALVWDGPLSVVSRLDDAHAAVAAAGPRLRALEVALPAAARADEVRSLASLGVDVFVEVPRDARRSAVLEELAATGLSAKFRTGGLTADMYPSPAELAGSIVAAVRAGVPFKATAGLHHAVRHTDAATGITQHGFLNLLVATAAARAGAPDEEVGAVLASRDECGVADGARALTPEVRESFRSFGTCSIREPLDDLARLGLLPTAWKEGAA